MNNNNMSSGGVRFCGLLTILFIALKLLGITEVSNWSWWWVFSPIWIPIVVILVILVVLGVISLIIKELS